MRRSHGGILFILVTLAVAGMLALTGLRVPAVAAQGSDSCPAEATVASLQTCVQHAAEMGFIDNQGVTKSLLAMLDAAEAAESRGQPQVAVNLVQAFVRAVEAQSGKHINEEQASHMIMHAQSVIAALQASS